MRARAFDMPATPEVRRQARRIAADLVIGYTSIAVALTAIVLARTTAGITSYNLAAAAIGSAAATEPPLPTLAACAARDLRLVTLIEHHGDQQTLPSDRLAYAYFTMMEARNACRDGRVAEALRIYDGITLGPTLAGAIQ